MLAQSPHVTPARARDEHGFTLVEMVVAMATGIIVSLALFAILDFSVRQSGRLNDLAQATQLGRGAMTKMVDELHSACLSPGFTPVQEKSSATSLRFINANSPEAVISKTSAYQHNIEWKEEAGGKGAGVLTDYKYAANSGELPTFTFSSTASPTGGTRIGEKIAKTGSTPIFQYYEYSLTNSGASETPEGTLAPVSPPTTGFTAEEAKKVAAVLISFNTAPADKGSTAKDTNVDLSNQVTFAFSVPQSETKVVDTPCQ
jgi:Tfp pilus assembly protein PilW